jgi:sterol desaturase/sphingolipid hydroxylase (fatty acid hydroxylase superfamily)
VSAVWPTFLPQWSPIAWATVGVIRTRIDNNPTTQMQETISQLPPVILVAAYAVFWCWEALLSARGRTCEPGRRWRNLALSAICIAIAAASGTGVVWLSAWAASQRWGLLAFMDVPIWATTLAGILLLDVTDYARHRLSHAVPLLWRLHRVHHSDPVVDVTTSLRNHPLEILVRPMFLGASVVAFGIPPLPVLLQPLVQLPVILFQHANIRLPLLLDRALAWIIVTPGMHLVHHSRARREADSNYTTMLSVWDRLFRTFTPPGQVVGIGTDGLDHPRYQTLFGMLATPWR